MCLFIIMSISVRRHELWCTARDMRLGKCSIIIYIYIIIIIIIEHYKYIIYNILYILLISYLCVFREKFLEKIIIIIDVALLSLVR